MTNSLFTLPVDDIRAMYAVEGRKTRLNTDLKDNPFKHIRLSTQVAANSSYGKLKHEKPTD